MQMRKFVSKWFLILMIFGLAALISPPSAPAAEFNWKAQDAFGPQSMNNYSFLGLFDLLVKERSKGRIAIQHFDAGGIVGPFDIFSAVSKGTVDLGSNCGAYYSQRMPEADLEYGLVYDGLPRHLFYEMVYQYKGGAFMKILREAYREKGIHYLVILPTYGYGFMTNFPFRKLEDLRGKKIRTSGTIMKEFLKKVGAAPVVIPTVEVYTALQRGTIDGITLLYQLLRTYKWVEIIKYVTFPDVYGSASLNLLMNAETYDKLPADLKKIVDDTATEVVYKYLIYGLKGETDEVLEWAATKGVKMETLPEAEVAKIQKIIRPMDQTLLKNPRAKQLYEIRKSFLEEKGIWK
jgi:TRAP-type C4-dicarboxylate transport system substrate-binding protein